MSINLSIKNAPDDLVRLLRLRAERNHRSMQGEMLAIIEAAVKPAPQLSFDEVVAEIRKIGHQSPSESTAIIREARDRGYSNQDR